MSETTVILADDHPLFRGGLKAALDEIAQCRVVGEAKDGAEAISLIAARLPQVAFVDLAMPDKDGYDVVEWACRNAPDTACIIMTMYKEPIYLHRAIDAGAQGFLVKDDAYGALRRCLDTLADGDFYISPGLGTPMPPDPMVRISNQEMSEIEALTQAQRTVLRHIAEYKTSKEIAALLQISPKTVENHRMNIARTLGLRGPNRLIQFAARYARYI